MSLLETALLIYALLLAALLVGFLVQWYTGWGE